MKFLNLGKLRTALADPNKRAGRIELAGYLALAGGLIVIVGLGLAAVILGTWVVALSTFAELKGGKS